MATPPRFCRGERRRRVATSSSESGTGGQEGCRRWARQASVQNGGGFKRDHPEAEEASSPRPRQPTDRTMKRARINGCTGERPANRRWRRQPAGAAARRRTGEGMSDGATEIKSDDPAPPPVQGGDNGRPMTPGDFRRRRSPGGFYGGRGRSRGTKPRALPPRIVGFGAFVSVVL